MLRKWICLESEFSFLLYLHFFQPVMHANSGTVIMIYRALVGIIAVCMTTFRDANIGMTCFSLLFR